MTLSDRLRATVQSASPSMMDIDGYNATSINPEGDDGGYYPAQRPPGVAINHSSYSGGGYFPVYTTNNDIDGNRSFQHQTEFYAVQSSSNSNNIDGNGNGDDGVSLPVNAIDDGVALPPLSVVDTTDVIDCGGQNVGAMENSSCLLVANDEETVGDRYGITNNEPTFVPTSE